MLLAESLIKVGRHGIARPLAVLLAARRRVRRRGDSGEGDVVEGDPARKGLGRAGGGDRVRLHPDPHARISRCLRRHKRGGELAPGAAGVAGTATRISIRRARGVGTCRDGQGLERRHPVCVSG